MRVHFIEQDGNLLAFFPDSLRFFEINQETKNMISDYICSKDKKESFDNILELKKKYNLSDEQYDNLSITLDNCFFDKNIHEKMQDYKSYYDSKTLDKLVLNITNKCNLNCKYCYASGGNYKQSENFMSFDTAKAAIDAFFWHYKQINIIQLFGGEPLLNVPLVKKICEYIEQKLENNEISQKPQIGAVTNGTIASKELIELIKKYDLALTVSIDGPPIVHDSARIFKESGKGSASIVIDNIKKLIAETGQPTSVETTYNNYHVKNNITVADLIEYFHSEFGIDSVHLVPVCSDEYSEYSLKDYSGIIDSIDEIFKIAIDRKYFEFSLFNNLHNSILEKAYKPYICKVGMHTLAVSSTGDIYPCFCFIGNNTLKMGNVHDKNIFNSESFMKLTEKFRSFNKLTADKCSKCFANTLCNNCIAMHTFITGEVFKFDDGLCDMFKRITEKVIIGMYKTIVNQQII